jgi:hypothetical protein
LLVMMTAEVLPKWDGLAFIKFLGLIADELKL